MIYDDFDYDDEEMEMPTPCVHCDEIFDLNDGYGSEKWHENITICPKCHEEEEKEIEEDERWENINTELNNALYNLDNEENLKDRLDLENVEQIRNVYEKLFGNDR